MRQRWLSILLVLFLITAAWLLPKLWRGVRRLHTGLRSNADNQRP